jgi:transposase InsO family protein
LRRIHWTSKERWENIYHQTRRRLHDENGLLLTSRFSRETNGKLEKLFGILETGLARGIPSIDDCVYWYNCERPHGALNLERAETPMEAYYRKLPQRDILLDPSILIQGQKSEMIS